MSSRALKRSRLLPGLEMGSLTEEIAGFQVEDQNPSYFNKLSKRGKLRVQGRLFAHVETKTQTGCTVQNKASSYICIYIHTYNLLKILKEYSDELS